MAILSNAVVNGSIRCLNKIYAMDLQLSGSMTVAGTFSATGNISSGGDIIAAGNLKSTVGYLYLANEIAIKGYDTWLRINDTNAFTSGIYLGSGLVRTDGTLYVGTSGQGLTATSSGIRTPTINNTGMITTENLNVANLLRATRFDLQTVSQTGGSLYVSPTIRFDGSGNVTTLTITRTSSKFTLVVAANSITTNMAGIAWSVGSKVKMSGEFNGKPSGTMDGEITAFNASSHTMTVECSGNYLSDLGNITTATDYKSKFANLAIAVYQRKDGNNNYRVGIWLNCYDIVNNSASIRIYGGTSTDPNVVLGNLASAGLPSVGGQTVGGWGLFTQNGYFTGTIVSTSGTIGGWSIGTNNIHSGTDSMSSTTAGLYLGTGGIRNYKDANTYVNITNGVITAKAVDLTGKITAINGKIGKFNITSSYLDTYQDPANATAATNAGMGGNQAFWAGNTSSNSAPFRVSYDGSFVSTKGTIGGWTIDGTNGLKNNDSSVYLWPAKTSHTINLFGVSLTMPNCLARIGANVFFSDRFDSSSVYTKEVVFQALSSGATGEKAKGTAAPYIYMNGNFLTLHGAGYHPKVTDGSSTYDLVDSCYMANDMWGRMKFTVNSDTSVNIWGPKNHITLHSDGGIYVTDSVDSTRSFELLEATFKKHTVAKGASYTVTSNRLYIAFIYHPSTANSNGVYMFRGGSTLVTAIKAGSNLSVGVSGGTTFSWSTTNSDNPTCYLYY